MKLSSLLLLCAALPAVAGEIALADASASASVVRTQSPVGFDISVVFLPVTTLDEVSNQEMSEILARFYADEALSVFVCPPSIEELSRRLHGRGDTSEEMIQKRLAKASIEMEDAPHFDVRLINDTLEHAFAELDKLVCE